jgi:two-component system sensor histidine kinase AlgZ
MKNRKLMSSSPFLRRSSDFLPNFCSGWVLFNVIVFAELLAVIIAIVGQRITTDVFKDFFLLSVYIQWIGLASAAALCLLRGYLNRLPPVRTVAMAYAVLLCVAWAVGELAVWALWALAKLSTPHPDWYFAFHVKNLTVAAIIDALALRYFMARHQLRQSALAQAQAEMEVLKYRIRPHFLFNSMNIIATLTRRAPAKAEAAIEDMADVFRLMLDDTKSLVQVGNEINVCKKYLALEKLRLDNRLQVEWEVGEIPRTAKMPVLMLQLLLESTIYFGVEALPDGGKVTIRLHMNGDMLIIDIEHPLAELTEERQDSHKEALNNIRRRLAAHYGSEAVLEAGGSDTHHTLHVTLPAYGGSE